MGGGGAAGRGRRHLSIVEAAGPDGRSPGRAGPRPGADASGAVRAVHPAGDRRRAESQPGKRPVADRDP